MCLPSYGPVLAGSNMDSQRSRQEQYAFAGYFTVAIDCRCVVEMNSAFAGYVTIAMDCSCVAEEDFAFAGFFMVAMDCRRAVDLRARWSVLHQVKPGGEIVWNSCQFRVPVI